MTTASQLPNVDGRSLPEDQPEIPQGWLWTTLGSVAEVRGGVTKGRDLSRFETIEAPYLRVANVQAGYLDLREVKKIAIKREELEKYQLRGGDVLFTEGGDRDKLARGTVWRDEIDGCVHQNHIFCARPHSSQVLPEWLSLASQLPASREYFWSVASQTVNLASISLTNLKAWPIPLPPLSEQRRIVERVEALLAQARTARYALAPLPEMVRRLRQAVLAAAFSGRLSEPEPGDEPASELLERVRAERVLLGGRRRKDEEARVLPEGLPELPEGWVWTHLGDVLAELKNGFFAGTPASERPGVPILRISAVRPLEVNFTEPRFIRQDGEALNSYFLQQDDLLFTRYNGSLDLVGVCGRVRQVLEPTVYPDKLIRARTVDGVLSAYVEYFFATNSARKWVESRAKSSAGQQGISGKDLKAIPVPLAPLSEQRRIVERIEALLAQVDIIEQAAVIVSRRIIEVERAVLARAFRGELVEREETVEDMSAQ